MKTERNAKLDNVKCFLIACVVLGHLGNRYSDDSAMVASAQFWVYLFHMPAFVFISGLFSKKTIDQKRWNRVVPYLFLYVFMKMFSYTIVAAFKGIDKASIDFFSTTGVPWFALAMFWWLALSILVSKASSVYVMTVSILLALASGYITEINNFLVIQRTLIFFPFFYAGYLIDPAKLLAWLDKWYVKAVGAAAILGSLAISFTMYDRIAHWRLLFRAIRPYNNIQEGLPYAWGWAWRLTGYLISAILTLAIIALMPKFHSILTVIGQRTLSIYAVHNPMIFALVHLVPGLNRWVIHGHTALHCLIFMVVIIAITALPIFDWPIRKLMYVPPRRS